MATALLREVGSELLEHVSESVVVLDKEAAEALRWSIGLASIIAAGAQSVHLLPCGSLDKDTTKLVVVFGRYLHECQKDIGVLLHMDKLTSCHIFSLFSDEENMLATDGQYSFDSFKRHCKGLLASINVSSPTYINQIFVSLLKCMIIIF